MNSYGLLLALAGSLFVSSSSAQDKSACGSAATQLEMNQCAHGEFTKADAELNRLYKQQMSHLDADGKKRLQASQRAWLAYRDSACLYETGTREESGSIWPMQNSLCQATLTRQRNVILKAYVACRQDGCP
jgi:uncharacterized protein YecT (DUF1311 family)